MAPHALAPAVDDGLFIGPGPMAARMRALDWSGTSLGRPEAWPRSLRTMVRVLLTSRYQMWLGWGPELAFLYNDAYRPTLGSKEPHALGAPAATVWREIWADVGPRVEAVMRTGAATWDEGLLLLLERNGYPEETYHTFSYSPLHDDDGAVRGLLCVVTEETERVIGERRTATLRDLASSLAVSTTAAAVLAGVERALETNGRDVPFAMTWLRDGDVLRRVSTTGLPGDEPGPREVRLGEGEDPWSLARVLETNAAALVDLPPGRAWPTGPWSTPPRQALVLPVGATHGAAAGALVLGLNPHRVLDDKLRGFLELFAGQVTAALAASHAFEEEKMRAEALAALDRAKTAFFSNVSHELRTPLTLILGPVQDALSAGGALAGDDLQTTHRNSLRLLKLVNTLLDFSRIEAGRAAASFRPTDLGALTRDLASAFRAAIERAGLRFDVEVDALPGPVWVDHDMWEKIVLNLLSNAFKFTFTGAVSVRLRAQAAHVEVVVADTGVGIPEHELPRVFERFHRVEATRGRTHEGSGIGMALVAELVRLHGGTIDVASELGRGTAFTIRVPLGKAHLPAAHVHDVPDARGVARADEFVMEALRWLPQDDARSPAPAVTADGEPDAGGGERRARILLADDNADMRDYVCRLLSPYWDVQAVADGAEALAAARRQRPELVLTDVMMPNLDGFGLLRALREDDALRGVPVMMVSARAGEEARIEGLEAGAADYVVKPFTARELVARVRARLEIARLERAVELERQKLHTLFMNAPAFICVLGGPTHVFEMANGPYLALIGDREIIGRTVREALPEVEGQGYFEMLDAVLRDGKEITVRGARVIVSRGDEQVEVFLDFVYQPRFDVEGRVDGVLVFGFEVTAQVRAQHALEAESRKKDEFLAMLAHELRNPLAPVRSSVYLAQREADADRRAQQLAIIERQTDNLARIVDDLLDVSRITRGLVELKREPLDVEVVLRSAVDAVAPLIAQKRHQLVVSAPHPPLFVLGDAVRLEQILVNLLTNAAKYTDPGGHIRAAVELEGEEVVLRVSDDGIGIAPEVLPRVFDLFSQAERGLDRAEGGLGIGLTVVKNLVEMHGGRIEAKSAGRGAGAELVVRLPAVPRPASAPPAPAAAEPPWVGSVLVVDDNVDAAESLADLLDLWGHEVRTAYDGAAALAAVKAEAPDVVFLDLGLPGMSGYEVARALRADEASGATVLVALTGYGQAEDRERTRAAGFDAHLVKPVAIEALQALLKRTPARRGR